MLDAVCAGHLCLDMSPTFLGSRPDSLGEIFTQGRMTNVRQLRLAAGGSVANTGLALIKFGFDTALMAKIGGDHLGELTGETLEDEGASSEYLTVVPGEDSSYSIVLSVPGYDRMFLHDPAVNRSFTIDDIDFDVVRQTRIFHLGYATLMRELYENDGAMLVEILKKAKDCGATTSLDTAMPDPGSDSARADWERIYAACLPYTDIFCPSLEELFLMTDPSEYYRLQSMDPDVLKNVDMDNVSAMASRMVGMGAEIVVIKCGYLGCYLKTGPRRDFRNTGRGGPKDVDAWVNRELYSAPFRVREVKSAIGAGGVTIAGFLAALLDGAGPEEALTLAEAAGAYCVASHTAVGDLVELGQMKERVSAGWPKNSINYSGHRLTYDPETHLYHG